MRAEDFFALKIRRLRPGLNPRTWLLKASTLPPGLSNSKYFTGQNRNPTSHLGTQHLISHPVFVLHLYRSADNSLARPRRKQARKHVRDARDFNNIETRAVIKFLFLQGNAPKEIHAFLTKTLLCFLPGRAKDLSSPL